MNKSGRLMPGLICGLISGILILGVGGRLIMRFMAMISEGQPSFSISGTMIVLAAGAIIGTPSGLIFTFIKRYLPGKILMKGIIFGLMLYLAVIIIPVKIKNEAAMSLPEFLHITIIIFSLLFIIHGMILAYFIDLLNRPHNRSD